MDSLITISKDSTLVKGIIGGVLIAGASSALLYLTGNITGISGIFGRTVSKKATWTTWRVPFLIGLISSGTLLTIIYPQAFGEGNKHVASLHLRPYAAVLGGLLVGYGTRMANGCTSGHGVCGLPRRSPRSLAAVLTFMGTGALTAYLVRTQPYIKNLLTSPEYYDGVTHLSGPTTIAATTTALILAAFAFGHNYLADDSSAASTGHTDGLGAKITAGLVGLTFGLGLGYGGMTDTDKLINFLDFSNPSGWDITLIGVMGGAVMVNLFTFDWMSKHPSPALFATTDSHGKSLKSLLVIGPQGSNMNIDTRLLLGSAIFGIGWAIGGSCPGPAIVSAAAGSPLALVILPSMIAGFALHDLVTPSSA